MRLRLSSLSLFALLVVAACSGASSDTPAGETVVTPASQDEADPSAEVTTSSDPEPATSQLSIQFDEAACPFGSGPSGTEPRCGFVTVPEDRSRPEGRSIRLAVAVFPPTRGPTTLPPVLYLEGGPGGEILEAVGLAYEQLFAQMNEDREVILFDQRGTGYSEPSLACPEAQAIEFTLLGESSTAPSSIERRLEALEPCRDRWTTAGIDLAQYNSADSAADVADLRSALGYAEWDLYGVSYGTRLALTVMRDHPEGIRSVVLDSTYPPEVDGVASIPGSADRAFSELFAACDADAACASEYGDLESRFFETIERLDAEPVSVTTTDIFTGERYPTIVDGTRFLGVAFQSMYAAELFSGLPDLLIDIERGEYARLELLLTLMLANTEYIAIGQNYSVQCHEEVPFSDPATVASAAADHPAVAGVVEGAFTQSPIAFEFCESWGAGIGEPVEADPVSSGIPTLVVGGRFDPITPPEFGETVSARLTNSTFVEFPGLGHGVAMESGCPASITLAFLADPTSDPDVTCVENMMSVTFVSGDEVVSLSLGEVEIELLGTRATVVVPETWEELVDGTFFRSENALDSTALIVQPLDTGGLSELLISAYATQFSDDGELDEVEAVDTGGRTWRRFSEEFFGGRVDLALFDGTDETLVVILLSQPPETDELLETVLIPALDSLTVLP